MTVQWHLFKPVCNAGRQTDQLLSNTLYAEVFGAHESWSSATTTASHGRKSATALIRTPITHIVIVDTTSPNSINHTENSSPRYRATGETASCRCVCRRAVLHHNADQRTSPVALPLHRETGSRDLRPKQHGVLRRALSCIT